MVNEKEISDGLEWRVRIADGSSEILVPESVPARRSLLGLLGLIVGLRLKVWRFFKKAWKLGVNDPRKVIHGGKVGIALTLISLFYYMRPLYEGLGRNAMWAVMTVVVVFEFTVGATISKSLNRTMATLLAGSLAVGVHWVASQSGEKLEPIIAGGSVFVLASLATFCRFIPLVKARFEYGAIIFILTFSLISVAGYRVDKLLEMARQRVLTIAIGTSMCMLISMLICPIWSGQELYLLITRNMQKLANSLDGCMAEYFKDFDDVEESHKTTYGYKCVLNSKAIEETMANFAGWEPGHGRFSFRHPWRQYPKIGASMRSCAYCIEALNSCINSEFQAPESIKKHFSEVCMRLSFHSSSVLEELGITIKTMKKSSKIGFLVAEMNIAVQELQNELKYSFPNLLIPPQVPAIEVSEKEMKEVISTTTNAVTLVEVLPIVTVTSVLIEIAARIERVVDAVEELASLADYKSEDNDKPKQKQPTNKP